MLDTVKINHVQHISFTQSRLTDAVSVILSELLSYEHPSKKRGFYLSKKHNITKHTEWPLYLKFYSLRQLNKVLVSSVFNSKNCNFI